MSRWRGESGEKQFERIQCAVWRGFRRSVSPAGNGSTSVTAWLVARFGGDLRCNVLHDVTAINEA